MTFDTLLKIVLLLGACAGAFFLFRSPTVYFAFLTEIVKNVFPILKAYVTKRMTKEQEKELKQVARRGGEWDPLAKKERESHK